MYILNNVYHIWFVIPTYSMFSLIFLMQDVIFTLGGTLRRS